jgi:hypothetical protein
MSITVRILSVTFDVEAQDWAPEFTVPKRILDLLGVDSGDEVELTVLDPAGDIPLDGTGTTDFHRAIRIQVSRIG